LEQDRELNELRAELLVVRCQCRDPDAVRELVERYGPRLRYYLRKLLKRQDVEDAMQDVWLQTLRRLATLRDPRAFAPWWGPGWDGGRSMILMPERGLMLITARFLNWKNL